MAITRAQIARQLYQFGGGADAGKGSDFGKENFGGGDGVREQRISQQYKNVPKTTIKSGKDFRDTQKVKEAFTKETLLDKAPSIGLLSKLSKFDPKFMKDFAKFKSNQDLLDYINSLDEEDQSSGKLASALIGYGDFLAEQKGLPALKFSGDVGGLEQFVKKDGTFGYRNVEGGQPIIPQTMMASAPSITEQGTEDPQGLEGLRLAFRAEGGPIGGIMDIESGRQMYFLGKLVKKATRAVKKIAKSPIGKAALLGAVAFGIPGLGTAGGLGGGIFGRASFGGAAPGIFGFSGIGNALALGKMKAGNLLLGLPGDTGGRVAGTGLLSKIGPGTLITAASALAGLLTEDQEQKAQELSRGEGIDIEEARRMILQAGTSADRRGLAFRAEGGRIGYQEGSKEPVAKKTMPLLDMGGKEMDLREEGGFVPIGRMEKADDVPARLSKNEFVFTADAVRNAGDGDVDKGAEVMYNMMKNLEAGGDVSKESQGLEGARRMFQTSQRLEEVL